MKAAEVLRLLRVTRPTLTKYVQDGSITVTKLPNGRYDYDEASVYAHLNKDVPRQTCIYARVISKEYESELRKQVETLKEFCYQRGYTICDIITDVGEGVSYFERDGMQKVISGIIEHRYERVVVEHKSRIARAGFDLFEHIANRNSCGIIAMNEVESDVYDLSEVADEVASFMCKNYGELIDKDTINTVRSFLDGRVRSIKKRIETNWGKQEF